MSRHSGVRRVRMALLFLLLLPPGLILVRGEQKPPRAEAGSGSGEKKKDGVWNLDEVLALLNDHPRDGYLQYVALQLARREGRVDEAARHIEAILDLENVERDPRRSFSVDLFSSFTGALSIQEVMQLETLLGRTRPPEPDPDREKRAKETVEIAKINVPEVRTRDWRKLLGEKKVEISHLARSVPADQYFVEFHSLAKMLDLLSAGDQWAAHLFPQIKREARTQMLGERLRKQLAIETGPALGPIYDAIVSDVAVTGSDVFLGEGSDVTLLFRLKSPDLFRKQMDAYLAKAVKEREDVRRSEGKYLGIDFVQLSSTERDINVFSAYPEAGLHVRSNSRVGFERVLAAIKGKDDKGKEVRRLGDTDEFAYIRSLLTGPARDEDGFLYLSDPFIRRLLGPQVKLSERRRLMCYNNLRMAGHAALMFRTERGRVAASIDELAKNDCCPARFNTGDFVCGAGGTYALSADGLHGVCSHHGHAHNLIPNCENPLNWVNGIEADEYQQFANDYGQFWRPFFDPVAVRVQVTQKQYRFETIVLPKDDHPVYDVIARVFQCKAEPLDTLPVPKRNIFTLTGRLEKENLLNDATEAAKEFLQRLAQEAGLPEKETKELDISEFLLQGLDNQIGYHVYDASPMFDLNVPEFLGLVLGQVGSPSRVRPDELLPILLATALNSPIYFSLPVKDEKIVDKFLDKLDPILTRLAQKNSKIERWLRFEQDFYKTKLGDSYTMRTYTLRLGPAKARIFLARIGKGLYVASKQFILEDLAALEKAPGKEKLDNAPDAIATGHLMLRVRARNWNEALPDFRLGWAENYRQACLNNLGPIGSSGRALVGQKPSDLNEADLGKQAQKLAERIHAVHFFCPEGGQYLLSRDGKTCSCSVHGTKAKQQQDLAPTDAGPGKLMREFGAFTTTVRFDKDGVHAIMTLEKK